MATLLFVAPPGASASPPTEFGLLTHTIVGVAGTDRALTDPGPADLLVLDARTDLAWAKTACQMLLRGGVGAPVLLVTTPAGMSVLSPEWGFRDFVLDGAQPAEVDARIRLALSSAATEDLLVGGPITIDEAGYAATLDGQSLDLTYTEFELLKYLVLHPGRVLTREHLLSEVWGYDYYGGTRTVDVHVRRLRAKLGAYDGCISTVRNVGYRFSPAERPRSRHTPPDQA